MENDVILSTKSWLPVFVYYGISILLFILLYYIKLVVDKKMKRPLFIVYTFVVPIVAALQFGIFYHGYNFLRDILFINYDIDPYDSIMYGALFFAVLYCLAMPRNKYVKFV